ncbi:MAG: hypothetical protein JO328_17050 [Hyphomicrobiales bacterium]|nr:hypothetical protein [Hyphomicrobiales bacterium]MBV8827035.1 hypothetical protein [Hyphomicrobiales bacterium]
MMISRSKMMFAAAAIVALTTAKTEAQMAVANYLEEDSHAGVAKGADANQANANAIAACEKNGGPKGSCMIYATIIRGASGQKTICLSAAQGNNGDFGYGTGVDKNSSVAAAIKSCKIGAVAPRYCKHVAETVCQTTQ